MANTEIRRTTGSTPTNAEKFTVSLWFKISNIGSNNGLFGWRENSNDGNNNLFVRIGSSGNFQIYFTSNNGNDNHITLLTNRLFRDCNAFYHAVISVDSSQSTSSDRVKLYINGVQETSFSSASYPANGRTFFSNDTQINFGKTKSTSGSDTYFSGIQSHIHFTDGYAYDATPFGETDSTTGEWKIKTSVTGVTYGNNGFFWLKDSIATTDHSPNSNTFSVGNGTLTKTEDNPSNVFATLNKLSSKGTFSYGNTEVEHSTGGTTYETTTTTLGMTSGKYYCEAKITFDNNYPAFGIASTNSIEVTKLESDWLGKTSNSYGYFLDGVIYNNGSTMTSGQSTFATNDIIGMALDLDSAQNTLKFYKNGSLVNTTNITTNSNGWFFGTTHVNNKTSARSKFNFGNGYFRSDAISSAGTNASNNGIFEYDVPSGYTALSTKGLNL
jgi:hypothetical protein